MIPSLLQIPSAVSDSKLHSVLPNNGKGDFTFDRSTGATRINKDGLIEEVGYFSSELVQNGNFSELGNEELTNGDFSNGLNNWALLGTHNSDNYAIVENGKLILRNDGTGSGIYQNTLTIGKTYKITLDVSEIVGNGFKIDGLGIIIVNTVGTKTFYAKATETNFYLYRNSVSPQAINGATIDNVSVKQVDPNDRWALQTGWSYGSNKVIGSATTSEIQQDVDLPSGKVYKTTFTIEDYVSGDVRIRFRGGTTLSGMNRSGNGTYTQILTSTGHSNIKIDGGTSFTGSVTNISVVEVQGDRPRLSYDITNGVVDSQPHLLLEPSSTNLVTFSEDFSQWSSLGSPSPTITTNFAISPDGTQNASRYVVNSSSASTRLELGAITVSAASHTFSLYIKNNTGNNSVKLNVYDGSDNNQTFTATDTWQRISYTLTTSATSSCFLSIRTSGDADFLIYGAQFEQLSYSTSLIPTAGTTITRAAETCNNSKPSVNSTEGVLYAEIAALADDLTNRTIAINDGTTSNTVRIQYLTISNAIWATVTNIGAGGNQAILQYTSLDITNNTKVALQYKANDFSLFVNGIKVATDSSGATFSANTLNTLQFDRGNGAEDFYGKVKGLAVYNEALSESQLMQLTGVTASSIYNNFVTRTASFTVEALNEVKKVIDNL